MHFSTPFSAALVLLSFGLRARAHGFPVSVTVDGKEYAGANGQSASNDSPFRKVSTGDPVTDPTSDNIICGQNAQKASSSATAKPGSVLKFTWAAEAGGNWFHNDGPIMTYMAACSGDCSSFSPDSSTKWFKIDEQGESTEGDSSTWAQADLLSGAPATVKIPDGLAADNYLVRHEIIALQNSQTQGGAEFYPSCLQVTVGGNDSGEPNTTVNFPGAYKATDSGILGNFYNPGTKYVFPGGNVATIGGSSSSSGSSGSGSSSAASPTKTASSKSSGSSTVSSSVAATSTIAVANSTSSPSASSTATGTAAATSATPTGRCSSNASKKRRLRRRAAVASDNGTTPEVPTRRSLKMHHKRRAAHALSL